MQKSNVTSFLRVALKASPYKRRPTQKRTWMTVPEMGKLLGLKKTDRYWLVHKNVFESKEIAGKIRINIASFEKWYANQIKYHKVIGEEPGKELNICNSQFSRNETFAHSIWYCAQLSV